MYLLLIFLNNIVSTNLFYTLDGNLNDLNISCQTETKKQKMETIIKISNKEIMLQLSMIDDGHSVIFYLKLLSMP